MRYTREHLDLALRHLYGSSGVLEDRAKLAVGRAILDEMYGPNNRNHLLMTEAGMPVKEAVGSAWGSSQTRVARGQPLLGKVLSDDPYFKVADNNMGRQSVYLDMSAISMFIPDSEPMASDEAGSEDEYPVRPEAEECPFFLKHGWCQFKGNCRYNHPRNSPKEGIQYRNGLHPIRPGEIDCKWWLTGGYCHYKKRCRFNHPPLPEHLEQQAASAAARAEGSNSSGGTAGSRGLPIRPGAKSCPYLQRTGKCTFGMKCYYHHPDPQDGSEAPKKAPSGPSSGSSSARVTPRPTSGESGSEGGIRQPDAQLMLEWVVDGIWPPEGGKEAYIRGALAKRLISQCFDPDRVTASDLVYTLLASQAGDYLKKHWVEQTRYDSTSKPYDSLNSLLAGDSYLEVAIPKPEEQRPNSGAAPRVKLHMAKMLERGCEAAVRRLSSFAANIWPPRSDQASWARHCLVRVLLGAGLRGAVLLEQLSRLGQEEEEEPSAFRCDMAVASHQVRDRWQTGKHSFPVDAKLPWGTSFKGLISQEPFLHEEPGTKPGSIHVVLDVEQMVEQYPWIQAQEAGSSSKRAAAAAAAAAAAGVGKTGAGGPGPSRPSGSAAGGGSSSGAARGRGSAHTNGDEGVWDEIEQDGEAFEESSEGESSEEDSEVEAAAIEAAIAEAEAREAAAAAAREAAGPSQQQAAGSEGGAGQGGSNEASGPADWEVYEPPPMNRWWPQGKGLPPRSCWAEIAVKVVDPQGDPLALAEVAQHMELCGVMAVSCATYKSHPHLLTLFLPHGGIGDLVMPATVYLLDTLQPRQVREVMGLIKHALESKRVLKVVHSSKQWSHLLQKYFGINLQGYIDTQQANYVWQCLRAEQGRFHGSATPGALKQTSEVSLNALMHKMNFYHPIRHKEETSSVPRLWQVRPLGEELIECAAADVAYLLPVMEQQLKDIAQDARELAHQTSFRGSRGLLPFESSMLDELAKGWGSGSQKLQKLLDWANTSVFHQSPKEIIGGKEVGVRY